VKKSMELFGLAILCAWLAACGGAQSASGPQKLTAAQQAAQDQMDTAVAGANKTAAAYKAMDNVSLITKLNEQSAARMEPFNSPAYRELVGRTDVDPQAMAFWRCCWCASRIRRPTRGFRPRCVPRC
jgi:hypothetical protein